MLRVDATVAELLSDMVQRDVFEHGKHYMHA
jgi:hypothetical protein